MDRTGRAAPRGFLRAKTEGNPEENPVHPNSFIWIYILFKIGHFGDFLICSNIDV